MASPRWTPEQLDPERYVGPGHDLPVFYGDLDTNAHVNNVALGRFFEMGRVCQHRDAGISALMHRHGGGVFVASVRIDYLREAHFGSPLHLRLRLAALGTSSFTEAQAAWQDGQCVALAEVVLVWVSEGRPTPLPAPVREVLESLRTDLTPG